MKKTDNRHYNRASKRILAFEMTYWCWWHNKYTEVGGKLLKIIDVEYIGNSVYGGVKITLEDKTTRMIAHKGYRPIKTDLLVEDFLQKHKVTQDLEEKTAFEIEEEYRINHEDKHKVSQH